MEVNLAHIQAENVQNVEKCVLTVLGQFTRVKVRGSFKVKS